MILFLCAFSLIFLTSAGPIEITCTFSYETWVRPNNSTFENYQCIPSLVNITEPNSYVIVTGDHLPNKTNDDVTELEIIFGIWNFFPSNFEIFFKNIGFIIIGKVGMKNLKTSDLEPFKSLQDVEIFGNKFEVLEPSLMEYLFNLPSCWVSDSNDSDRKHFIVHEAARQQIELLRNQIVDEITKINEKLQHFSNSWKKIQLLEQNYAIDTSTKVSLENLHNRQNSFELFTILMILLILIVNILSCFVDFRQIFFNLKLRLTTLHSSEQTQLMSSMFPTEGSNEN